ncbi:MAG: carbon starvation protein A [Thermodesulfobacteriota bacterium]
MLYFILAVAALLAGYAVYGTFVAKVFGVDENRPTPASRMADGVDYVSMPVWKVYLVQLLNIAGLGPIFGPILGALYGPAALLWIVLGTIFAGAVHDFFSGMMSVRYNGLSIPDVVGKDLGNGFKQFMRAFSIVLLILVGVVFVLGPAKLMAVLTPESLDHVFWSVVIFGYYVLATMLPIDKIIGRVYPIFAAVLLFMAVGLMVALVAQGYPVLPYDQFFTNLHPKALPLWPLMFITIACGAISGFHSTQSPLMARCLNSEKHGKFVFYGGMVGEGVIALIWATLGMSFYPDMAALQASIAAGSPSLVVKEVSMTLLGGFGGALAIIGVVILPVTSGDTAFRGARLIVADFLGMPQKEIRKRLMISVPLFAVGLILCLVDFNVIWRYFAWSNQSLATVVLWSAGAYMIKRGKPHWIATLPAIFMTAMSITYIANAKIGLNLPMDISTWVGLAAAAAATIAFFSAFRPSRLAQMTPDEA